MAQAKKSTTAVAKKADPQTTALTVPNYGKQFEGAGWENTDSGDFQIPFLNQLQALSPQCEDGGDRQVEGARPGMFYNSVTQELYSGAVRLLIALTKHSFVEWKPQDQGGGFVGEYAIDSDVVREAKERAANPLDLRTEAGNELVETYQVFALILDDEGGVKDQVVISFSKTKIKRYKQIMTRLRTFKGSNRIPLFAHQLVMTSTNEKNPAGQPYKNVQLAPAVDNDVAASLLPGDSQLLELANALREAILEGAARANFDSADAGTRTASTDDAADEVFGEGEGD